MIRPILYTIACIGCLHSSIAAQEAKQGSPLDDLPHHISRLTHFGQRADWSHDGTRILFLEKTFGDVFELELATRTIRPITHHYFHEGYTRALYLSNGDILLSGAKEFIPEDPWPSRSEKQAELWVLKRDLSGPPQALGTHCSEGPAVSRRQMKIAWTLGNTIYTGNIVEHGGQYKLDNKTLVLKGADLSFDCSLETQNFRPPHEDEIIFSAYNYRGGEVMGVNITTRKITNYSNQDNQYDEPEGIFPDGQYTLVESDRHASHGQEFKGHQYIDIHKLALDGSGRYERITHFNDYEGYKASNPVVSDDGRFIAFQMAKLGDPAGVGRGLFMMDLQARGKKEMD